MLSLYKSINFTSYIRVIFPLFFLQSLLFSTSYYVDGSIGDDTSDCDHPTNPCLTIEGGIAKAVVDGDEVIIASGTYVENLLIERSITLKSADPNDPAIIDGSDGEVSMDNTYTNWSCIIIKTPTGSSQRVEPTIEDLVITGGRGTQVTSTIDKTKTKSSNAAFTEF